jgi:hypothetical protein
MPSQRNSTGGERSHRRGLDRVRRFDVPLHRPVRKPLVDQLKTGKDYPDRNDHHTTEPDRHIAF